MPYKDKTTGSTGPSSYIRKQRLAVYSTVCTASSAYLSLNLLINLTTDLDPVREVKSSRKLCSNPKKFDSRIVQPITIQLISSFGWPNICGMPTATINGRYGDPVIIRRDLDVFRTGREDGGLHNVGVTVQNEGRERNARDDRVRDGGGEEGYLSVW